MDKTIFDFLELQRREMQRPTSKMEMTDCLKDDFCVISPNNNTSDVLTMAFVNMQPLDSVYELNEAFKNGTLFPNINKPFFGGRK